MATLASYLTESGTSLFEMREQRFRQMTTPESVRDFQQKLRAVARDALGSYVLSLAKDSTPPQIISAGELQADGIIIEKFLYEVFPSFWAPAVLYRPARDMGPCPALIMPVGHWWEGKAHPMYQHLMRILARRGVICASFDSCGQGERIPWFNPTVRDAMTRLAASHPTNQSRPFPLQAAPCHGFYAAVNVTSAHCLIGDPGYLCGVHQHALTAVAGKRLVDLLAARKDVQADRIGACGASGGGTDTRFLAALDDRLALAVVASIMGSTRMFSAGDADQSCFDSINQGVSSTDLVVCLAPKPLLIVSSSVDHHDTHSVAAFYRPFWATLGNPKAIESGIGQGEHGFPPATRKIVARFVLRHLRGETHDIPDAEHADDRSLFLERDLWASLSGNLECDGIGKTAFDLIHERTVQLARERPVQKGHELRATILATLREDEMTLKRPPERICTANTELLWEAEGGVYMRAVCEGHGPSMTILAYNVGSDAVRNSVLYDALRQVNTGIARLDVRGIGISATSGAEPNGAFLTPLLQNSQANLARMALQQGRTLTGMRTVDMLQAATVLRSSAAEPLIQKKVETVNLMANSGIGFAALLAAVLAPETFRRVILYRTPLRWQELTTGTNRVFNFPHFLYGVLERFDTPDLTRALSPDRLIWINPVDGAGNVVPESEAISAHRGGQVAFRYARTEQELVGILNAALG